ncbi:beta-ketoacyl-[acyl-carrier-protein] synthase family protein [Amycolatopsis sp. DG1A-15b]|uniref:beta-ketoacyl-[acyl-carrier-protein] synthase family protein n=1 Tax=Amycolatopsis sp. DG1A-15b TaxID=3052846 RepID=UPI00255BAE1B|nr:beta-ketoacyl-[acyl-carrier-protein] synthase family protein [Amycolatopsis sp. DG1A-15b]WIX90590.1 beta-ketoacyl-[acyl-carrier-protein] synthase family protein [Amycolatopsis sp. DG1A-15b]
MKGPPRDDVEVVVTGVGATTPLGGDVPATWQGLLDGRAGASTLDTEWTREYRFPVRIAARLAVEPAGELDHVELKRMDRAEQLAVVAARQACRDADLAEDTVDPVRCGVVIGTGIGGATTLVTQHDALRERGLRAVSPQLIPMVMPNGPAALVGIALRARAGVHAPMSACASGAEAIAWAWRMIVAGEADVVVAGGTDACITPAIMAGFTRARSMSTRNASPETASRPFDAGRDGFVLGEGAGILVLERAGFAAARGAKAYGRLAGAGMSNDAHHITAPDPDGAGQSAAITTALRRAGLAAGDIGHVNAHATSTPLGDLTESVTIRRVLGDGPVVTAPKGALGHLLGGSGAVEAIATLLSIRDGLVPPTANLDTLDDRIGLDVVAGEPRRVTLTAAISNSFGFGGHNVTLAFAGV